MREWLWKSWLRIEWVRTEQWAAEEACPGGKGVFRVRRLVRTRVDKERLLEQHVKKMTLWGFSSFPQGQREGRGKTGLLITSERKGNCILICLLKHSSVVLSKTKGVLSPSELTLGLSCFSPGPGTSWLFAASTGEVCIGKHMVTWGWQVYS